MMEPWQLGLLLVSAFFAGQFSLIFAMAFFWQAGKPEPYSATILTDAFNAGYAAGKADALVTSTSGGVFLTNMKSTDWVYDDDASDSEMKAREVR